jgi:hypothetical protein
VHRQKQQAEIVLIDEWMQIDRSDEQPAKTYAPIYKRSERDSNVTFDRFVQSRKQEAQMAKIDEGIQTDRSDEQV